MEIFNLVLDYTDKIITLLFGVAASIWAFNKWKKREEHFPRINFKIDANIIGKKDNEYIVEVISTLENKGLVPLKISHFICNIRGLKESDKLLLGNSKIRGQVNFKHLIVEGPFFPDTWDYSFVYPGVTTKYSYITKIPESMKFILIKGRFHYYKNGESHHAGKLINLHDSFDGS
ncbi:MAG: hypothetical protein HWD86_00100 [Kangiellaceae bacterium]|nr:hypothetical protein [Kangiellaceae bacterium]